MKTLKFYASKIYLLVGILFYWFSTSLLLNWVAIGLLLLLGILFFTKNKVLGILYGIFFALINLYMVLALLSELSEFPEFNTKAIQLLIVGSLFLSLNLFFSIWLIIKYSKPEQPKKVSFQNQSN